MSCGDLRNTMPMCKVIKKIIKNREQRFMLSAKRFGGFLSVIRFVFWQDIFAELREQPMKSNIHPETSVRRDIPEPLAAQPTVECRTGDTQCGGQLLFVHQPPAVECRQLVFVLMDIQPAVKICPRFLNLVRRLVILSFFCLSSSKSGNNRHNSLSISLRDNDL